MARASLVKVDKNTMFIDNVFGSFITTAPQNKVANACDLVESTYGSMEQVIKVLEADGYEIRSI